MGLVMMTEMETNLEMFRKRIFKYALDIQHITETCAVYSVQYLIFKVYTFIKPHRRLTYSLPPPPHMHSLHTHRFLDEFWHMLTNHVPELIQVQAHD